MHVHGGSDQSVVYVVRAELKRNEEHLNRIAGPGAAGESNV